MPKKQGSNYKPTKQEQLNAWKNSNNAYAATIAQLENMKNGWGDHSNVTPSSFGSRKSAPLVDKEGFASRYQTDTIPKLEQQEIDMGIGQDEFMRVANQQNEEKEQKAKREQEQLDFANSLDSGSKLDLWLGEGYKLNNGEKKEAKQIVDDYLKANPNAKRAMYGTGGASNAYVSMTPEQQAEYQKMATLSNKISASGTIGAALSEEIPFLDELLGKAEDFYGVDDKYGIKAQQENAKTQNGLLYGGTKLASEMGKYAVGGSIAKGIKPIAKLGELTSVGLGLGEAGAGVFTSMIGDQLVDLSLDTLPQVLNDVQDGKDKQQIIRDAVTNFGTNAVFNIIGGAGEAIFDAGKGIAKNSDDIAELVEGAAKQTDEATDAIKSLSDRLPGKTQLEMEQEALGRGNLEQLNSLAQEQYALSRNQQDMDTLRKALEEQSVVPKVDEITQKINDVVPQIDNSAEEVAKTSNRQALVEQARAHEKAYKPTANNKYGKLINSNEKFVNAYNKEYGANDLMNQLVKNFGDSEDVETVKELKDLLNYFAETGDGATLKEARSIAQELDSKLSGKVLMRNGKPLQFAGVGNMDFEHYSTGFSGMVDTLTRSSNRIFDGVDTSRITNRLFKDSIDKITDASYHGLSVEEQDALWERAIELANESQKQGLIPREKVAQIMSEAERVMKGNAQGLPDGVKNAGKAVDNATIPFVETVDDVPKADNAIPFVRNIDDVPKAESTPGIFDTTNGTPGAMRERSYDNRTIVNKTDMPDEIKQEFIDEPDLYRVISNEETSAVADEIMASNDFNGAYSKFNDLLDARDPASIPLGYDLARQAAENKNYDLSVDILERMSEKLTKAGQFTQAAAIRMMGSDPMAAQRLMQREIAKINKSGVDKFGRSWKKIALNETELEAFKNINKGDTEAIENLFDSVTKRVAKEIPATAWEKIVEATKTSMMLNPRTHIRNTASNTVMVPIRSLSDRVSALGQNAVHLFDKDFEVTQSLVGGTKEQKKIAGQIFDTKIKPKLEGNNEYKEVAKNATRGKQVFNDSMVGKGLQKATLSATSFANNITGGRLQKLVDTLDESLTGSVMENLRKFDYYLLGAVEDDPFVKSNFKNRLASYMKAQGINAIDDVPDEAVQIAYQEALKATFKDDNYLTKMFSGVKGNLGKFGEVLFPFTKTPANLAKRGIEYSPAGFVESLIQLKKEGKLTTEIVDNLSKNAVGTAGIFIGYELAKNGMINGSLSDNKREKQFQKQQGKQAYSINIGGQSYTFDWAQPGAIPLIIGATIYDAIKASDDEAFEALSTFAKAKKYASTAKDGAVAMFDSWADLTPLQSFKEIFGGNGYGDGSIGENIINAVTEFPLRLIPAAAGSAARTVDKTYRETYVKDDPVETLVNQAKAKIPALGDDNNWWNQNVSSKSLPASYDGWGRERTRQDTTAQAAFANFVNPGSMSNAKQTEIDTEILRLFEATGDEKVFPRTAEYSVKDADKKDITLNNEQHSELQRELGVTSYDLVSNFIKSDAYNTLDDTAKKNVIRGLYDAANEYVKNKLYGTEASDKIAKMLINGATPEEVSKYVKMSADFNKYGLTMTEKNIAAYERAMRTGNAEETVNRTLQKESERREVYKANNVNSGKEVDAIFEKAYASGGSEAATQALKQYKQEKQMFSKYGMEDNETARKVYEEKQSEDMLAKYSRLYKLGKQKDKIDMLYSDDFESIPTLDKGYLLAQTISGNQVTKPLKDAGNYEAFFAYYDVKRAADENGNDSLNKKEKALAVTYLMKNYGYTKEQAQIIAKEWYK